MRCEMEDLGIVTLLLSLSGNAFPLPARRLRRRKVAYSEKALEYPEVWNVSLKHPCDLEPRGQISYKMTIRDAIPPNLPPAVCSVPTSFSSFVDCAAPLPPFILRKATSMLKALELPLVVLKARMCNQAKEILHKQTDVLL